VALPYIVANDLTTVPGNLGDKIIYALTAPTSATPPGLGGQAGEVVAFHTPGTPTISSEVTVGNQQVLRFGPGEFTQSKSIKLVGPLGAKRVGAGRYITKLLNTSNDQPSVILSNEHEFGGSLEVGDLAIDRPETPVAGMTAEAIGIDARGNRPPSSRTSPAP
jgi:hypothetical protein